MLIQSDALEATPGRDDELSTLRQEFSGRRIWAPHTGMANYKKSGE